MANLYDLKKFDLNLLVIFEYIYQHLSISKAAETLYTFCRKPVIATPAHAIQRLSIYSFRQRNYAYRNRH